MDGAHIVTAVIGSIRIAVGIGLQTIPGVGLRFTMAAGIYIRDAAGYGHRIAPGGRRG